MLELSRLDADGPTVASTRGGYSTHTDASRILDEGLPAGVSGDGTPELLLPTADRRRSEAVRRADGGTQLAGPLSLGAPLVTNLRGVSVSDDGLAVGAGTGDEIPSWRG